MLLGETAGLCLGDLSCPRWERDSRPRSGVSAVTSVSQRPFTRLLFVTSILHTVPWAGGTQSEVTGPRSHRQGERPLPRGPDTASPDLSRIPSTSSALSLTGTKCPVMALRPRRTLKSC